MINRLRTHLRDLAGLHAVGVELVRVSDGEEHGVELAEQRQVLVAHSVV
jgi:uncharacterized cupin superfamily protein